MRFYDIPEPPEVMRRKTQVPRQGDRFQPTFGGAVVSVDMHIGMDVVTSFPNSSRLGLAQCRRKACVSKLQDSSRSACTVWPESLQFGKESREAKT